MPIPTSIDAIEQPAMIIDLAAPAIRVANQWALRLWGLDTTSSMPIPLDPAMPAMKRLRIKPNISDRPSEQSSHECAGKAAEALVFWTAAGAQNLRCRIEKLANTETILVIFENGTEQVADKEPVSAPIVHAESSVAGPDRAQMALDTQAMAHELRTPIGAIIALAEMIETEQLGPISDPRYRDYARDIGDSARLALGIVAGTLEQDPANSINLTLEFAELNVTDLINKSLRTVRQSVLEAGIHLDSELAKDLPNLIASAPGLMQILLNLLSNAIKFTPKGGTVSVAAHVTPDSTLQIAVSDTGVGMTDTEASILIDKPKTDGTAGTDSAPHRNRRRGIGFSLVRRLASAMSAEFDVTSTRGVGTCVTLTFPSAKVIPIAHARS